MSYNNIPGIRSSSSNGGATTSQLPKMSYNIMCVAGFIASLFSVILVICFFFFSSPSVPIFLVSMFLLGIAALVVSIIGIATFNKDKHLGFGFGITGLVISIVSILSSIIITIVMLAIGTLFLGSVLALSHTNEPTYTGPVKKIDNYEIRLEDKADSYKAMLASWFWSGDPSDNVIEIPDTYEDITICAIGDTNASSFEIKIDPAVRNFVTLDEDAIKDSKAYVSAVPEGTIIHFSEVEFTLKVGKNIKMVSIDDFPIYGIWNEDGSITYHHITIKYDCSSGNPYFYSKNGLLYKRGSDKPLQT